MTADRVDTVALYARVSTNKQDEMLQLPRLRRLAETLFSSSDIFPLYHCISAIS